MQVRRLIRTRGLASFRRALVDLSCEGTPLDARRRVVLVPTRAAGELLRQTVEQQRLGPGRPSIVLPDFLTRPQWLERLHTALPPGRPWLSTSAREVLLERAARQTARRPRMGGPPFALRVGLVASMLDFYDGLRRRQRRVRRFAQVLFDQLRVERGTDRGSEGLVHQTAFLGLAFLAYERLVSQSGSVDEHSLRRALLADQPALPFGHLVIAVADHPTDPRGLWPSDFDLVGRLAGVTRLDVVLTDETHDAGFRERLEQELPGIIETRAPDEARAPVLLVPAAAPADPVFVSRDREEEVRDVARAIRAHARTTNHHLHGAVAVVFHRPLPYLYVGQQVLAEAQVPFQAFDALPLGAEPYAALLDQVLAFARTGGTREAAISLLRSPLLSIEVGDGPVDGRDAAALDTVLRERRATGDASTYAREVSSYFGGRPSRHGVESARAVRAAEACEALRSALLAFRDGDASSRQLGALAAFLRHRERKPSRDEPADARPARARAAVLGVIDELVEAYREHDDRPRDEATLVASLHHAIEARTFSPASGDAGVHLVDAVAVRFADVDHVHLVGLVETDWPERVRRSIFYTGSLLATLGWPQEADQLRAQLATFRDLLGLARHSTRLHAFFLEGDSLVALSPLVDVAREVVDRRVDPLEARAVFPDELMAHGVTSSPAFEGDAATWLAVRRVRPDLTTPGYSGVVGPQAPQAYRVSRVDRFVDCPFKYFAEAVLRLAEERDEGAGLTPLERGTLLHTLFEQFYRAWEARDQGTITADVLPDAVALFTTITHEALAALPAADRALEEARLLGSIVDRGVAERVFELEVDAGGAVARRLLEVELKGTFDFPRREGLAIVAQPIAISGKADRIDVFADGSLRVIDYKLGRLPDVDRSVQIAAYAHTAQLQLERAEARPHPVRAAMYLAFGDDRRLEGSIVRGGTDPAAAIATRAEAFAAAITRIEAGQFPASPHRASECAWCGYAGVCRKEYVAEVRTDDAADAL